MNVEKKYMAWKKFEYSKKQVDKAGASVLMAHSSSSEYKNALKIVDNWRAAHGYPLYVITNKLKRMTKGKRVFVVHRLKRLESIIAKLERNEHMSLRNMQDFILISEARNMRRCTDSTRRS